MTRTIGRLTVLDERLERTEDRERAKKVAADAIDLNLLRGCEGSFIPMGR